MDMAGLLAAFRFNDADELQDYLSALVLSECVYKAVDAGPVAALAAITAFRDQFPAQTVQITAVQFSRKRVSHRYLLAAGGGALYACFMGTKELRDVAADAAVRHRALWDEGDGSRSDAAGAAAHGGFLARADGIPVESLYLHATSQGLRLVLCGHSLGGAVAILATLRLLRLLGSQPDPRCLRCVCFGTPALGNAALAADVAARGWGPHFLSYCLLEDPVPRLLLLGGTNRPAAVAARPAGITSTGVAEATAALKEAVYAEDARDASPSGPEEEEEATQREVGRRKRMLQPAPLFVRAVGSLRALRPPPISFPFPAYSHFGSALYLCAAGVEESAPSSPAFFFTPANLKVGNWLSHHRMGAYRGRTLEICNLALRSSLFPRPEGLAAAVEEAFLAPAVAPASGESLLPVLWSAAPEEQRPTSRDLWARLKRREAGLPALYPLKFSVFGSGLEACTAALLQLPNGASVPGRVAANYARENSIVALRQQAELKPPNLLFPPSQRVGEGGGGMMQKAAAKLQAARAFAAEKLRQLQERVRRPQQHQSKPASASHPELVLEFSDVPTAALLALRVGADGAPPTLSMAMFSDFAKVETAVALRATSVWVTGLSDGAQLGAVQQLWQEDQQVWNNGLEEGNEEELNGALSRRNPPTLAGRAWQRLRGAVVAAEQPEPPSTLPATLLRGLLVTDVTAVACFAAEEGSTAAAAARLNALADLLLKMKAAEAEGGHDRFSNKNEEFELWDELEAEDELFTVQSELGAGAKLRRMLRRALMASSSSARQRRRRGLELLARTPPPDLIVIAAAREDLIARSSFSEALDDAVLNALQSAAAAAAKCRAVVLVAVAAPEARDASWRRQLSFLSGLHGRPGAVVPVGEAGEGVPLLQEAMLAHAAALQAERALRASEKEKNASSVLRARL